MLLNMQQYIENIGVYKNRHNVPYIVVVFKTTVLKPPQISFFFCSGGIQRILTVAYFSVTKIGKHALLQTDKNCNLSNFYLLYRQLYKNK